MPVREAGRHYSNLYNLINMEIDFPVMLFESAEDWSDWLEVHHNSAMGLWIRIAKKAAAIQSVSYYDAVTAALCYGWIDGIAKKYDADSYVQRYTPRKPGSIWSLINKERALQLIEEGLMKPSGLAAIDRARKNGNWDKAYEPQSKIQIPEDLKAEFKYHPDAYKFFETLDSQNKYAILHRIQKTKSDSKRKEKIAEFIEMLLKKQKIY
jgi:uncharacterized protein YdeI (YjbR/CyaY-like superfamily)